MVNITSLTEAWADNMRLTSLNAAVQANSSSVNSTQGTDPQRFWATPDRDCDDESQETMEITLSNERLVNHITFDLAKFPHDCHIEYFDTSIGDWRRFLRADVSADEECRHEVMDCNPPVIPAVGTIDGHYHPQHSFSGHWETAEFVCRPVRFQRIRVVLKRHSRSRVPCNSRGVRVAFSLAVRGLYCGYKVYSQACIPAPQPVLTSFTEHQEFTTTTDVLGSQVSYVYRVNRAENVLRNDPNNVSGTGETLIWRSEPQPFPHAVVNYFLDVRDQTGGSQILDRIFLDPVTDGANVNLYYSNDEPEDDFDAPDDPLPPQVAVPAGQVAASDPLGTPDQTYGRVGWVDVDNSPICFRPGRKWWFGARLSWKFLRSIDVSDHPIFDCGAFHLAWTRYGLRFAAAGGDYFHVDCDNFDPATEFTFVSWHVDGKIKTKIKVNGKTYYGSRTLSVKLAIDTVAKMRIAGFLSVANVSADFRMKHMVLKMDQEADRELVDDFLDNPAPYCVKAEFKANDIGFTNNAILRYNPGFVTDDFPTGLKGGAPTKYSSMEWSPIARDYVLRKGFLYFPPTKAKYWKLEFCGLTAEPYEVYVPIKKTVKTYRTEMWMVPQPVPVVAARIAVVVPGISVSVSVAASFNYKSSTSIQVRASNGSVSIKGYSSTSVRIATSVQVRVALNSVSWTWGFLPAHPPVYVPRFETKCVHEYDVIEVEQKTKIAYFVGLKAIQAYKVSYLAVDDTAQYTELFQDTTNLDVDSGWTLTNDHELTSGDARFAQAQSKIFSSSRIVRAVQFATTQSAPMQLLPDDDFDDPEPSDNWVAVGDGTLAPFTTLDERVGSILRIDRGSREPSWAEMITLLYPTWGSVEGRSWATVEASGNPAQATGGIQSKAPVSTPPGGRIYAAARVIAPADLSSPLYVQIIDDETGQVLSESASDVKAGQIAEWWTSYTIGEGGEQLAWRWKDFSTNPAYPTYVDNFQRANAAALGNLLTNQAWLTAATTAGSHSINSNEAVTTVDNQYDYVDALTPWGTMEMSFGTIGSGTNRPLMHLSPINLDDQGVITFAGGRSALPTTSVLGRAVQVGDAVRVDIMPMAQVPVNRRPADWVDNVQKPYALLFYLNGTWVTTVGHRHGSRTRRGFYGRLNQRFRSFSWTPSALGALPGPVLGLLPVVGNGSFDSGRLTWTDNEGFVWATTGTLDNSTTPGVLTFTSAGARIVTDTRYWYGTLNAGVRNVAAGTQGKHGDVLVLDADIQATINAAGNVIEGGVNRGNLFPGGIPNNSLIQVQFLDTKSVAPASRGAIDPAVYPKLLAGLVNGSYVGVLAFPTLKNWQGTRRGIAGDVYDGTAGSPIADFHTSFDSFCWAPDASNVPVDPKTPKWDEVSQKGTGTYDSMAKFLTLNTGKLRARVIQRGSSIDVWDMDTLSLFADPIVWSFSNDGGLNFYNAYDIKNNPYGVQVFPEGIILTATTSTTQVGANPGQSLVWRVVSYAPNQKISALTIRPWYGGLLSGITHRVGLAAGGPNKMPYDHYPPITDDARFQTWNKPIPQDWFYQFRILKRSVDQVVPRPKVLLLPEGLVSQYKSEQGG